MPPGAVYAPCRRSRGAFRTFLCQGLAAAQIFYVLSVEFSRVFCYNAVCEIMPEGVNTMSISVDFTDKEFRRLLDVVYIGNWILNSARGDDRIADYDELESKIFAQCARDRRLHSLFEIADGEVYPSRAFEEGGIHEAIMDYEDVVFYDILAEELAVRDMGGEPQSPAEYAQLEERIVDYINDFEENGLDNVSFSK